MQIRKCESVTTIYASEVANLDPEKFRNVSVPFQGNTDLDFLNYINELRTSYKLEEISDELDEELQGEIGKLCDNPEIQIWSSVTKGADEWLELGHVDESTKRNGGFDTWETAR